MATSAAAERDRQTVSRWRLLAGFVWTLVRTDFKTRYHGTIGGFAWALLKPLAMFLVLLSVFSFVFAARPGYKLYLLVGLFLWDFFAEGTKVGLASLHAKGYLLTKARFPSWIVVVASISNPVITLLAFSAVITLFLSLAGRTPGLSALALFGAYLVLYAAMVVGFSLATSVLFLRYRDLNQVWEVVAQAGFFVAPIVYPLGVLPEPVHKWLYLWPPTPVIQYSRSVLVDGVVPSLTAHLLLLLQAALVLSAGISVFRRGVRRAAEYL